MAHRSGDALRARICWFVRDNPGVHFRELQRSLALSPGQASHHLHVLETAGLLVGDAREGYKHYFAAGAPRAPRPLLAALRQPARQRVARALHGHGPMTIRELASATGFSPSTVRHHLGVLVAAGAVREEPGRPLRHSLASEAEEVLGGAPMVQPEMPVAA